MTLPLGMWIFTHIAAFVLGGTVALGLVFAILAANPPKFYGLRWMQSQIEQIEAMRAKRGRLVRAWLSFAMKIANWLYGTPLGKWDSADEDGAEP